MISRAGAVTAVTTGVVVEAVVMGEVEVMVMRDLLCVKGGKMVAAVIGRQRDDASTAVSLGILPGSADPRRSWAMPTWPRWRNHP
jgi:hypothetical protein